MEELIRLYGEQKVWTVLVDYTDYEGFWTDPSTYEEALSFKNLPRSCTAEIVLQVELIK